MINQAGIGFAPKISFIKVHSAQGNPYHKEQQKEKKESLFHDYSTSIYKNNGFNGDWIDSLCTAYTLSALGHQHQPTYRDGIATTSANSKSFAVYLISYIDELL